MILQALYEYYQRNGKLPRPGFEEKEFKYLIVIGKDGTFDHLACLLRDKKNGTFYRVPKGASRSGKNAWQTAYLLWDHYGYVLKHAKEGKPEEEAKNQETAALQNARFIEQLRGLPEKIRLDEGVNAVLQFYAKGELERVKQAPEWEACKAIPGCNLTFQLKEDFIPVPCRPAVVQYITELNTAEASDSQKGCCLVTGKRGTLSRLMSSTPVPGGQSTASLVSFQTNSGYDSYGKTQCYNAPISKEAEFACTTALNSLLSKDSLNKFYLKDLTAVFWVEKKVSLFPVEDIFFQLAQQSRKNAENKVDAMRTMCEAVHSGKLPSEDKTIRYYFLGLSPNAARISVRFWKSGTIGELAENITQHFDDLRIIGQRENELLPLASLLSSVVHEYKMENVPPNLPEQMLKAIFDGMPYPSTLLNLCLQRVRSERNVTNLRAAVLKGYLNRKIRPNNNHKEKEIIMTYDPENPSIAYQCGALFAVLEKAQEEANHDLNATICDRYFSSASTTPATVFGTLLRLNKAHLKKLHPGRKTNFDKMIGGLIGKLGDHFPRYFDPEDQGRFAIGYYQRRQALFETINKEENKADSNKEENKTDSNKGE